MQSKAEGASSGSVATSIPDPSQEVQGGGRAARPTTACPDSRASASCPPCCISRPTRSPISVYGYRYLDHLVAWDVVEERHAASLRVEGSDWTLGFSFQGQGFSLNQS